MALREGVAVVGTGLAIGIGWGVAVESHTNEVARGKIITAQYCLGKIGTVTTIDQTFIDCVSHGVPGGREIGKDKFHVGDPTDFVTAYIEAQHAEANSIEAGRIVGWSAAPFGVAAAVAATAGFFGLLD